MSFLSFEERQQLVSRLMFCQSYFDWSNRSYYIDRFRAHDKMVAESLYTDILDRLDDCISSEDITFWMEHKEIGLWSAQQENALEGFYADTEKLKLKMIDSRFQSDTKEKTRRMLRAAESEIAKLETIKNQYRYLTREGIAIHFKIQYLVGASLKKRNGNYVFKSDFWKHRIHPLIKYATIQFLDTRLGEKEIRQLARTEPWLSIWGGAEATNGIFDYPAHELTDEQRSLIMWTRAYENARGTPEMGDDIIMDDDVFDGWMLKMSKERKNSQGASWVDSQILSDKVRNSEHVFIIGETREDIERIENSNTAAAKAWKSQYMAEIRSSDRVRDQDTSFGQNKMRQQLMNSRR